MKANKLTCIHCTLLHIKAGQVSDIQWENLVPFCIGLTSSNEHLIGVKVSGKYTLYIFPWYVDVNDANKNDTISTET